MTASQRDDRVSAVLVTLSPAQRFAAQCTNMNVWAIVIVFFAVLSKD